MATVLITGGTGLVGKRLTQLLLQRGYEVIVLTRNAGKHKSNNGVHYADWNVEQGTIDKLAVSQADYIVHLAGANVAEKRWTEKRKVEIRKSRTESSSLLVQTLKENANQVKAVISASAVGWYGADNAQSLQHGFTEDQPPATDFLGEVCQQWEAGISPVTALGKRLVILRTGIVLSKDGGVIPAFLTPIKFGVATVLGKGDQIISWIHIDDLCNMYIQAIENERMQGVYNAVAPKPVSTEILTKTIARTVKGKAFISMHVPAWLLKIVLGEMSVEVLRSIKASSRKIEQSGFTFLHPEVTAAVQHALR
jgi:uncharacterized protein